MKELFLPDCVSGIVEPQLDNDLVEKAILNCPFRRKVTIFDQGYITCLHPQAQKPKEPTWGEFCVPFDRVVVYEGRGSDLKFLEALRHVLYARSLPFYKLRRIW